MTCIFATTVSGGQWVPKTSMPVPTGQAAVVTGPDKRIYLFGGWNSNPPVIADAHTLQIYDPAQDAWLLGAGIPCPSVGDSAIVTSTGIIHLLNAYEQRVYPYDPASNTWLTPCAAPWIAYAARTVVTPNGRCFVFGGERPAALTYEYFPDTCSAIPRTDVPYTPDPSEHSVRFPGTYIDSNDRIFVIGGMPNWWTLFGALNNVAVYRPLSDTWDQDFALMPTPRFAFGYVRGWNGFLYTIGGSNVYFMQDPPYFTEVEYYDPQDNLWHTGPPLPEGRRACAAAIDDNGVIYVFGGSGPPDGQYTTTVYALDTRVTIEGPAPADFDRDGDVDATDTAHFEQCRTGPAITPPEEGCENADLDNDEDVDQSDFGLLQRCFSGENIQPDLQCAD
jgi:hypothetical protein